MFRFIDLTQFYNNFSLVDEDVEHIALHTLKINSLFSSNLEISRLIHKQGIGFAWFLEVGKNVENQEDLAPVEYGKFIHLPII